ncbi:MAG: MlaD family protein [Chitinophagaceae bacterium]
MKNIKKGNAILTDLFVIAGLAILFAGIFIIGGKNKLFSKTVVAKAVFDDVNGLAIGNNVWYAGVKIGVVKKVGFINKGVEVSFSIEEEARKRIHTDTKVKLGSDGLIGNKIIVLYGGTPSSPHISAGATLLVANGISTEAIMATLQDNNSNLLQITNDFKAIGKGLANGNGTIGKLLTDESIFNILQSTMFRLNNAGTNAELLTSNLSEFTRKLNSEGSLANELVTDTVIISLLKSTVQESQHRGMEQYDGNRHSTFLYGGAHCSAINERKS